MLILGQGLSYDFFSLNNVNERSSHIVASINTVHLSEDGHSKNSSGNFICKVSFFNYVVACQNHSDGC